MGVTTSRTLVSLLAGFVLMSCIEKKPHSCKVLGKGLSTSPIKGRSLKPKQFSLTFDDGPTAVSARIGNYLAENGVSGTFFVQGTRIAGNEDIVNRLLEQGHLVANHTFNHPDLVKFYDPVAQMRTADRLVAPFVRGNVFLFRAPFGSMNEATVEKINSTELRKYVGPIDFDIGGNITAGADWKCWEDYVPFADCGAMYIKQMEEGDQKGIVLFHDLRDESYDLIKWVLPRMKERGYAFLALDEVPEIREALIQNGAQPGVRTGAPGCSAEPNP